MRATNRMLADAIPQLVSQVQSTNDRISRLERRTGRSQRSASAMSRRSHGAPLLATPHQYGGERDTYFGGGDATVASVSRSRHRARTAGTQRTNASSVAAAARDVLGKATNVLQERPGTAKTTKTVLSHRLRHGWSSMLRDGDIVKYAGSKIPRREGHNIESDLATGEVRRRVVKKRPVTAAASPPSCRRAPGYKAPHEDYWEVAPGEPREDGYDSFYLRPEDYEQGTGGYD